MHTARGVRLTTLAVVLVMLGVFGCSKSDGTSTGGGTLPGGPPSSSTTLVAGAPAKASNPKDCNAEVLTPPVQAKHAGVTLGDVVCDGPFAVATMQGGSVTKDGIVFLRFRDAAWTVVASGEVNIAVQSLMPADFSTGAFSTWQLTYQNRTNPTVRTTRPPGVPAPTNNPTNTVCVQQGDFHSCDTTTTAPTTVPQTTPDGSPVPTAPPSTSMFCRFNFADPRCKSDPLFTE